MSSRAGRSGSRLPGNNLSRAHVGELTELAPWVTYFALAPFVGAPLAGQIAVEAPLAGVARD